MPSQGDPAGQDAPGGGRGNSMVFRGKNALFAGGLFAMVGRIFFKDLRNFLG